MDWLSAEGRGRLCGLLYFAQKGSPVEARPAAVEEINEAVTVILARLGLLETLVKCGVCGGRPNDHASGLPCICGGSGLAQDEGLHAREEVFNLRKHIAELESTVARLESKLKTVVLERWKL